MPVRSPRLLGLVLAVSTAPACLPGAPVANAVASTMWGQEQPTFDSTGASALPITSSALRGDIGPVSGIDGRNGRVNSYAEPDFAFTAIDVTIVKPDGTAGMVMMGLSGIFSNLGSAPSGVYRANAYGEPVIIDEAGDSYTRIDGDEAEIPATDNDRVDVTLCAGQELDNWEYDAPAENVVVEVEEPVEYHADPEACPECEPLTSRRVTFVTETQVDDGFGNLELRRATGAFTVLIDTSSSPAE